MIITQTPLRISFLGGNTDFPDFFRKHGGAVLTTAIDKYIYCILTERFDDKIYVNWSKKEIVDNVDQIEHELVREAMKKTGVTKGVEISFLADIPSEGSGLGSSGSVLVGALNALYHHVGHTPTPEQLAEEAVEIEVEKLGKPVGVQDQYIAAFGGLRFLEFHKTGDISTEKVNLTNGRLADLASSLMLFYTGRSRLSKTILVDVHQNLDKKTQVLLQTKRLAQTGHRALVSGNVQKLGELMNEYWQLKKAMADNISDREIDRMYSLAKKAGAIGGKIAGAGGGGFLVLIVPSQRRESVRQALSSYKELPIGLERDGSKVIFNVRRY
ncbi:MAG: GHMP kinase [Patescibacteria group bacterium]|nr:GHMP kinase [Patescibacteria group bacterium]MCL5431564.1 GHMP kinase [Patescibacteria group bacterium]